MRLLLLREEPSVYNEIVRTSSLCIVRGGSKEPPTRVRCWALVQLFLHHGADVRFTSQPAPTLYCIHIVPPAGVVQYTPRQDRTCLAWIAHEYPSIHGLLSYCGEHPQYNIELNTTPRTILEDATLLTGTESREGIPTRRLTVRPRTKARHTAAQRRQSGHQRTAQTPPSSSPPRLHRPGLGREPTAFASPSLGVSVLTRHV